MAGVRNRRYADGCYRFWYIDRFGKQIFVKGTPSKRESLHWAMTLETQERAIRLGIKEAPSSDEVHQNDPIENVMALYFAWGETQGGRGGRPWSETHARGRRSQLAYWRKALKLTIVGDLQGKLSAAEVCVQKLKKGRTKKTRNSYIDSLKSFCSWCAERGYLADNPFQALRMLDGSPEVERRALTVEEITRLLGSGLLDWLLLYVTALLTGLRANELRQLTVSYLDCTAPSGVWLKAEWTKGRRSCLQPLPIWFVECLIAYGRQKRAEALYSQHRSKRDNVPKDPLFFVPRNTARCLELNLMKADIEKVTQEGKVDFHALRTTFSTLLDEVGASEKTREFLLRHRPVTLASERYVKVRHQNPRKAVNKVAKLIRLKALIENCPQQP